MSSLPSALYLVSLTLCLFAAALLGNLRTPSGQRFAYFTAFLVLEAACFGLELLMADAATPFKALWLALRMDGALLAAPCLWLALREIVDGARPSLRAVGPMALTFLAVGCLLSVPVLLTAHPGTGYADPRHPVSVLYSRFIHGTMLGNIAIFAVQAPWFLWRCRALLIEQQTLEAPSAMPGALPWLNVPLLLVFTTWVLGFMRTADCAIFGARYDLMPIFALIDATVTVAAIYQLVRHASQPEMRALAAAESVAGSTADAGDGAANAKYARSALDPELRRRIADKLRSAMEAEAVYRDSLLSLRSLSTRLKENPHYVSQVINQDCGGSFYEFVAAYRIEDAKRRLIGAPEQSVIEIAYAVGFNSKSTFNAAFRRITGQTPTEFKAAATLARIGV